MWRPESSIEADAFQKLGSFLENNDERPYSMVEFLEAMDT